MFLDHGLSIVPVGKIFKQDERAKFDEDFKEAVKNAAWWALTNVVMANKSIIFIAFWWLVP